MEIQRLFKPLLFISLGITLFKYLAWYFKIDVPFPITVINFALILAYSFIALREIYKSNKTGLTEKIMWTLGFIGIINLLAGLVYFLFARKRILRENKILNTESESFKVAE
jgi:hypothetical protein